MHGVLGPAPFALAVKTTTSAKPDRRSRNSLRPGRWKTARRPAPPALTLKVLRPRSTGGSSPCGNAHTSVSSRSRTTWVAY